VPANSPTLTTDQAFVTQTFNGTSNIAINHPWDIAFVDSTHALFTERPGRISVFDPTAASGTVAKLVGNVPNVYAQGESGLMGIAVDPDFANNHYIYVCVSTASPNTNQIRRFTVDLNAAAGAGLSGETLMLTGMPVANFHDGCRIRFQPDTSPPALFITMGDAGIGPGPQSLTTLAGKILRVRVDGGTVLPYPGNPFINSANSPQRLIFTWGHRNPQGIAFRPVNNVPFNAEHGPSVNDEVNRLKVGQNAGWDPNTNGNYDQTHPMTDLQKFPNAIRPAWRSGDSFTLAPSGMTFLWGDQWEGWNGAIAVAFLKNSRVRIMFLNSSGAVSGSWPILANGVRLRAAVQGLDGNLYLSTDQGSPNDAIWKVVPS
jgi:aldose sugar dehydrogenase